MSDAVLAATSLRYTCLSRREYSGRISSTRRPPMALSQSVACELLVVTKVLMVGRYRWSLGSRWSGRPHVLPGLRTADPAQHLLRHHRGVEVDDHSMRSVVVAFQAGDPFGVHPDPAAGEGEQLGLYGR